MKNDRENGGWIFFDDEKQSRMNELAIEYHKTKSIRIYETAAKLFFDSRRNIAATGRYARFYKDSSYADREEIVSIVSEIFCKTFIEYDPERNPEYCPYFRRYVTFKLNEMYKERVEAGMYLDYIYESDDDGQSEEIDIPVPPRDILISIMIAEGFINLMLKFFKYHNDNKKNQIRYIYFRNFYTSDIIQVIRMDNSIILRSLKKNEGTVIQSMNDKLVDYVMFDSPKNFAEIFASEMKSYSDINLESAKLKGPIELPLPQVVYSAFMDVSTVAVNKHFMNYKEYRKIFFEDLAPEER